MFWILIIQGPSMIYLPKLFLPHVILDVNTLKDNLTEDGDSSDTESENLNESINAESSGVIGNFNINNTTVQNI